MVVNRHLFLYGPPGSGKSTLGKALAESLKMTFIDLDEWIETKNGSSIPEIFNRVGEAGFRTMETSGLQEVIKASKACVIALGGGTLLSEENLNRVKEHGQVVCLLADRQTLLRNIQKQSDQRPLLSENPEEQLIGLLKAREEHYAQFQIVSVENRSVDKVVKTLQVTFGRFFVRGMGKGYPVMTGRGLLKDIDSLLEDLRLDGPFAIVSDENVAPLYAEELVNTLRSKGKDAFLVRLPAGEALKHMRSVSLLWQEFLEHKMERRSTVIALGGGVVTDLAGFAAATFLRGLPWVACPTSLLGMVDASIGGKTGVDLSQGKNLVGAFYPPRMVLADTALLDTLPDVEMRNGMAEVFKQGLIADKVLVFSCQQLDWRERMDEIVRRAAAVKVGVINQDPYEQGLRAVLNLGHTVGHALEQVSQYRLRHGEAVSIGILAEAEIAVQLDLAPANLPDLIREALLNLGLPVEIPVGLNLEEVMTVLQRDKKRAGGVVRFALPLDVGRVQHGIEVAPQVLRSVLQAIQAGLQT